MPEAVKFYPYDFDYKVEGDLVYVYLYGKSENGTRVCVKHQHKPYFFALIAGADKEVITKKLKELNLETRDGVAKVVSWEEVEKEYLGKKKTFWKIYVNFPKAVPFISKELESGGIECYEKDILFVHRYLRDTGITPTALVQATGEYVTSNPFNQFRVPLFIADKVTPLSKESLSQWKLLAVDIETYAERKEILPEKNPILMIGLYGIDEQGKEFSKVLAWKEFPHELEYVEILADEREMLQRFRELLLDYQPDILTGYFSDGFDLPYINIRAQKNKVRMDLGIDGSDLYAGSKAELREAESRIKGIVHVDVLKFVRNIFGKNLKIDSFSLDDVAGELLGHKKHVVNLDVLPEIWNKTPEKLAPYAAYCHHDAKLALLLCQKLLFDMMEFSKIIGLPMFDVIRMRFSRLVENYILTRAMEYNVLAPNRPGGESMDERREESIEGGFVFEPTPGLYKDIVVFDFRSLYPTIITSHNIGPEGFRCECCQEQPHVPEKEDYWFCSREKKFLPTVLGQLIERRAEMKKLVKEMKARGENTQMLESRSYALKILANSFYGYLGFFGARWYCLECAASTTAYARNYIRTTMGKAEAKGFRVIYADTDSCFVLLGEQKLDDALNFMHEVNASLPGQMELEFENYYPRGIFVAQKGSEKGAKKRYALISKDGKLKITGFETVRRNWSLIGKEVQQQVLRLVLNDKTEEALQYVRETIKELRKGTIPIAKVILKTQITKDLREYAAVGPHVAAAQRLLQRGVKVLPGTVVEYVITKGTGLIRDRVKLPDELKEGEYDAEYYVSHQLMPAVSSIFGVFGYGEEDVFKESSQTGLGKFW
ncbi:hypothetical protein HYX14_03335 [Candidatus Woesearchaeota archaeon]|nr:hypothetical protein [Candidatus Woesearchaeota archaeon]